MLRVLDIFFALFGLVLGLPVFLLLLLAGWLDTGSPLFVQQRLGRNQQYFNLVKFRTMRPGTASVASHLAPTGAITRWGCFLRKTKLDELPQLWNVLKGDMSLVGPRPNLPNQQELIQCRAVLNVYAVRPGITGLGQISGVDMSAPQQLAELDALMLENLNVRTYLGYILRTLTGGGQGDAANRR